MSSRLSSDLYFARWLALTTRLMYQSGVGAMREALSPSASRALARQASPVWPQDAGVGAAGIPDDFLPNGFNPKVLFRILDLVDRCPSGVLVLMLGDSENEWPLGNARFPVINEFWKHTRISVWDRLPSEALLHWVMDGAVVVDAYSGEICAVTVKVECQDDKEYYVRGGCRTNAAFSITRQWDCVAISKKLKQKGPDDVKLGWVSVFTSLWSKCETPRFHRHFNCTTEQPPRVDIREADELVRVSMQRGLCHLPGSVFDAVPGAVTEKFLPPIRPRPPPPLAASTPSRSRRRWHPL